jgi:hypothetical protein
MLLAKDVERCNQALDLILTAVLIANHQKKYDWMIDG